MTFILRKSLGQLASLAKKYVYQEDILADPPEAEKMKEMETRLRYPSIMGLVYIRKKQTLNATMDSMYLRLTNNISHQY